MPPGVPYGAPPSNRMPGMLDPTTGAPTGPNPGSFSMGPGGPGGMPMQGGGAPGGPSNMNPGGMPGHRTSASGPIPGAPGSPWAGSGQFPGGPGGPGPSGNPNAPTFFNPNEMNMGPGGPMGGNPQGMPQRGGPMPGGAPGGPSGAPGGPVPGPYPPQGMAGMPKGPATRMQKVSAINVKLACFLTLLSLSDPRKIFQTCQALLVAFPHRQTPAACQIPVNL